MMIENELLRVLASEHCRNRRCEQAIAAWEQLLVSERDGFLLPYQLGVCFSGNCRRHSLIDNEIALEYFLAAAGPAEHEASALTRARILSDLGKACLGSRRFPLTSRVRMASRFLEKAADLFLSEGRIEDWAKEQTNLGLNKCLAPEDEYPTKWKEAVGHFESALWVRTPERDPEGHAEVLLNLGTAYRALPEGCKRANVQKAIHCYRRALRFFQPQSFPEENATIHNNLANAFLCLPAKDLARQNRMIEIALRHFDRALRLCTKGKHPHEYARTQFNRGQALLLLEDANPRLNCQRAQTCFHEAAHCFRQCGDPALAKQAEDLLHWTRESLRESASPKNLEDQTEHKTTAQMKTLAAAK
jgi:tetratricopeptide (TPR) repeat protein